MGSSWRIPLKGVKRANGKPLLKIEILEEEIQHINIVYRRLIKSMMENLLSEKTAIVTVIGFFEINLKRKEAFSTFFDMHEWSTSKAVK